MKQRTVSLDLGCGLQKVPGAIGVDKMILTGVDVVHDLQITPYPFADNSFHEIHMYHVLEHMRDPLSVLQEVWRIAAKNAIVYIRVPHFSSFHTWQDPTHHRGFSYFTFNYLTPQSGYSYYSAGRFDILNRKIKYLLPYRQPKDSWLWPIRPLNVVVEQLAGASPFLAERFWCYWVGGFSELRATLRVVKPQEESVHAA